MLTVTYCQNGEHLMAKSLDKTILFGTCKYDRKVYQWPVATFNTPVAAKSYAVFLRLAYRANDESAIKALDPSAHRGEDDAAVKDTKWSLATVPYEPTPDLPDDDMLEPAEPAAA